MIMEDFSGKMKLGRIFLILGIIFLVFGIYRGEVELVFRKAVVICLECIGID
ncbi:putative membrane protein [Peptoniphilus sp. ING2-D1G]|nr:putative membrane protein [Peptoniphilus sp. ING2-D1G]